MKKSEFTNNFFLRADKPGHYAYKSTILRTKANLVCDLKKLTIFDNLTGGTGNKCNQAEKGKKGYQRTSKTFPKNNLY